MVHEPRGLFIITKTCYVVHEQSLTRLVSPQRLTSSSPPQKDHQTRKTHSRHRAAVAPRWMATVPIRVLPRPEAIHPVPLRTTRSRASRRAPASNHQPVPPVSNPRHSRIYNDRRRSKAAHNLLIQVSAFFSLDFLLGFRRSHSFHLSINLLLLVLRRNLTNHTNPKIAESYRPQ